MDFKQDSPTFNESCNLEANLVNPDEALQTGLPLQWASDMVSDPVPHTLVPIKSDQSILEAFNYITPTEEYYSLQPPSFQYCSFDLCNETEANDMMISNQGDKIWSGLGPLQGEADLLYTENFEMLTQVRNDNFTIEAAALVENEDVTADTRNELLIMDNLPTWPSVKKDDVFTSREKTKKEVLRQSSDSMVVVQSTDGDVWSVLEEGMENYNVLNYISSADSGEQRQEITSEHCLGVEKKSCGLFQERGTKEDKVAGILQDWNNSEGESPSFDEWEDRRGLERDGAGDKVINWIEESREGKKADSDFNEVDAKEFEPAKVLLKYSEKGLDNCSQYKFKTQQKKSLSRQISSPTNVRPYLCSVCERGFKSDTVRQQHENRHYKLKPIKCASCDSSFTTRGERDRHVKYKHTHNKYFHCEECTYSCVERAKLQRHMRVHTGERPFQCPDCSYSASDRFNLKRHIRVHTGEKPYVCDICDASFGQQNSMKEHRNTHINGISMFHCTVCSKTRKRERDLRIHMTIAHSNDHEMICSKCGKRFPDKSSLKVHQRSHQGEKLHRCDLCQYACSTPKRLGEHMLIHSDLKPLNCNECDQKFRRKTLLKRHQNVNHNPSYIVPCTTKAYKCTECTRSYSRRGNLVRHQAKHPPKSVIAQVSLVGKKNINGSKKSQAILEISEYRKQKIKQTIPIKAKYRNRSCTNFSSSLAENCGACKSCEDMARFGGIGSLKQRCKERKCKKANFWSQDQEARPVPVVKLRQSKRSLEKPGRKWSGFFQQVEKLSMENYKSQEEVNKSLNPVELLKVDKILDDVIMSFRIEGGVEQSVGSKLIHKM